MGKADAPKAMHKAGRDAGTSNFDSQTTLSGVPPLPPRHRTPGSATAPRRSGFWISTGPGDPREVRHLPLRRLQRKGNRTAHARSHRPKHAASPRPCAQPGDRLPAPVVNRFRSQVFQFKYTNRPASQSCSDLLKGILQELPGFHWKSCKEYPIAARAQNKSRLARSINEWPANLRARFDDGATARGLALGNGRGTGAL